MELFGYKPSRNEAVKSSRGELYPEHYATSVFDHFRQLYEMKGLRQWEAAKMMGFYHQAYLSNLTTGRTLPTLDNLERAGRLMAEWGVVWTDEAMLAWHEADVKIRKEWRARAWTAGGASQAKTKARIRSEKHDKKSQNKESKMSIPPQPASQVELYGIKPSRSGALTKGGNLYPETYTCTLFRQVRDAYENRSVTQTWVAMKIGLPQKRLSSAIQGVTYLTLEEMQKTADFMRSWGVNWSAEAVKAWHEADTKVRRDFVDATSNLAKTRSKTRKELSAAKYAVEKAKQEEIGRVLKPEPPPPNRAIGFVVEKRKVDPAEVRAEVALWIRKAFNMRPNESIEEARVTVALGPLASGLTKFVVEKLEE